MDQLGHTLLDCNSWGNFAIIVLTLLSYCLNKLAGLVAAVARGTMAVGKWRRGTPEDVPIMTPAELAWRGPAAPAPPDNEYFRDRIRVRNIVKRKSPNNFERKSLLWCKVWRMPCRLSTMYGKPFSHIADHVSQFAPSMLEALVK